MKRVRADTLQRREVRDDRLRAMSTAAVLVFAVGALAAGAGPARAATYKWVDEKGVVHYSDKMPPEAVDKASVELNAQGIPVKKTEQALTPEQRRAKEQEEARRSELAKQQEEVARRDRALVATYTSESEIDLARSRSLQTINNVIHSSQAYSEQLTKRKAELEVKKTESKGKPVTAAIDRELESIDSELGRQAELIAQKQREIAAITAKYDADKQRWRELVATKSVAEPAKSASAGGGAPATAAPAGPAKK